MMCLLLADPADAPLVALLAGLPLAMGQIVGFMKSTRRPIDKILQICKSSTNAAMLHAQPGIGSTSMYTEIFATLKYRHSTFVRNRLEPSAIYFFFDCDGEPGI
jgi:hypothetical protein